MKSAWLQSAGELFLIERYDDGSYGVVRDDVFLGFVARADHSYIAIDGNDGAVLGDASSLGAAAAMLSVHSLELARSVALQAA
jgi:hypothetical protein